MKKFSKKSISSIGAKPILILNFPLKWHFLKKIPNYRRTFVNFEIFQKLNLQLEVKIKRAQYLLLIAGFDPNKINIHDNIMINQYKLVTELILQKKVFNTGARINIYHSW